MNFFRRSAILKKANCLQLTPIRLVAEEIDSNRIVTVLLPKFTSKLAKKFIVPLLTTPVIKLKLDALGSASWMAIDGKRKVEEIAVELKKRFSDDEKQIEQRLARFLSSLYDHKLITFKEIQF